MNLTHDAMLVSLRINARSGREFAAWLGLVPRHSGTGGGFACSGSPSAGTGISAPC